MDVTITNKEHPEMGKIMKCEYDDGVCVYFSKKGMTLTIPSEHEAVVRKDERNKVEILFTEDDIDVLMQAVEKFIDKEEQK